MAAESANEYTERTMNIGREGAVAGLDRFEHMMERMVEGSVGRVFRSQVQPAEIGRRLERAMEARPLVSVNGTIVPNDYRVYLNPDDYATFREFESALCQSFEQWLAEIAGERGYRFMGPVRVSLAENPQVGRRDVQVQTATESPPAPPGVQTPAPVAAPRPAPSPAPRPQLPPDERTALALQRPQMVAPVAGMPAPRPPVSALPQGVIAHFVAGAGITHPLRFADLAIGRALDNDVVLENSDISRHHARLEPAGNMLRLVDLGSTNGTRVNGRRVGEHVLHDGDVVEFGSVRLEFRAGPPGGT